jgi:hypothetical protein
VNVAYVCLALKLKFKLDKFLTCLKLLLMLKRETQATIDIGILPEFTGTLVHNHWKPPYCSFEDCTHAEV